MCLVAKPLNRSDAKGDHVMLQTLLLFRCKLLRYHARLDTGLNHNKVTISLSPNQRLSNWSLQLLNGLLNICGILVRLLNSIFNLIICYMLSTFKFCYVLFCSVFWREDGIAKGAELTAALVNTSVDLKFFPEAPVEVENRVSSFNIFILFT